ncbi:MULTISPECIES: GAP family protein [unclassified Agrococcus]|uniref:GAP family protein n=1 Tax=unclassified Agrococcus TaxID=2615065 RepID=UPI00360F76B7
MDLPTIGTLVLLALADSTSFGTLLIPIWLLLASSRPSVPRMAAYLGTVAGFYLVMGVLLSIGARLLLDDLQAWLASPVGGGVVMAAGAVLFAGSFWLARRARDRGGEGVSERILRWRERALDSESGSVAPLMGLALAATALEVATLLPYLIAIGIMDAADLPLPVHGAVLAAYVVVMVLPAVVLLAVRLVAHRRIEPWLQRVNDWLMRQAGEMTTWIVAIVGFLLLRAGAEAFGGIGVVLATAGEVLQQVVQGLVPLG